MIGGCDAVDGDDSQLLQVKKKKVKKKKLCVGLFLKSKHTIRFLLRYSIHCKLLRLILSKWYNQKKEEIITVEALRSYFLFPWRLTYRFR